MKSKSHPLARAVFGNQTNATHGAAIHLGRQTYLILGTARCPENDPEPHSWPGRWRWQLIRALEEKSKTFRSPQLCTFRIQTPTQKALLRKHVGEKVKATEEAGEKSIIPPYIQRCQVGLPKNLQGGQLWFVDYECRPSVIAVSSDGQGFFAPGQDPCWGFSSVEEWRELIHPKTPPETGYYAIIGKHSGLRIGVCTDAGKAKVLKQSDTGKLIPISKAEYEAK